ncbi:acyclic terpene utilization AtuA family protein [Bacillus sp. AFS037270]|uniref:acyclic terpene utilization AtuA family protein n=1 Tax=Bacillus sp. AFS037270 TaxID=2033499 RepID=UPI0020D285C6|nr:acyclic terpene utilization AtuA family protein [Bacillus sp. AFS037270]
MDAWNESNFSGYFILLEVFELEKDKNRFRSRICRRRIEPAIDIIKKGNLDYIIFECLAERTIALAQQQKLLDPTKGYNELLEYRMEKILPLCIEKNVKIITNMGAANPLAAVKATQRLAEQLEIKQLKIAAVLGDDVYHNIEKYLDYKVMETGEKLRYIQSQMVSANAYIGAEGIVQALKDGADIVITGRGADPSLVVGPLLYEFGWDVHDYDLLGKGTLAGHLLECGSQVMGGYFADPGYKEVPDLWNIGFPIGEIDEKGDILITKLEEAGGMVTPETCKEQILYEIQDPENYYTPDVIADFSRVVVQQLEKNRVLIQFASGKEKTGLLKTSIGYKEGYIGEGEISYGGTGALERARLAGEIVKRRVENCGLPIDELRIYFIGVNSLYQDTLGEILYDGKQDFKEVRLRVAARTQTKEAADQIGNEVEALYTNGPAGGGGARKFTREIIAIGSILIPETDINLEVVYEEVKL